MREILGIICFVPAAILICFGVYAFADEHGWKAALSAVVASVSVVGLMMLGSFLLEK